MRPLFRPLMLIRWPALSALKAEEGALWSVPTSGCFSRRAALSAAFAMLGIAPPQIMVTQDFAGQVAPFTVAHERLIFDVCVRRASQLQLPAT